MTCPRPASPRRGPHPMPIESEIKVFEDRIVSGQWRVEYFDDDGGYYVAIFA